MKQLYHHQGNLYKILRRIRHHNFKDNNQVKELRDLIQDCDHVLKDRTHYLFCETIKDAEIIN